MPGYGDEAKIIGTEVVVGAGGPGIPREAGGGGGGFGAGERDGDGEGGEEEEGGYDNEGWGGGEQIYEVEGIL